MFFERARLACCARTLLRALGYWHSDWDKQFHDFEISMLEAPSRIISDGDPECVVPSTCTQYAHSAPSGILSITVRLLPQAATGNARDLFLLRFMFFERARLAFCARTLLRALGYWQNTVIGTNKFMTSKFRRWKLQVASSPMKIQNV